MPAIKNYGFQPKQSIARRVGAPFLSAPKKMRDAQFWSLLGPTSFRVSDGAMPWLAEIIEATGWQAHTVRGFVSILGVARAGRNVESFRPNVELVGPC